MEYSWQHFVDGAPTPENPDPIQAEVTPEVFSSSKRKLPKKSSEPVATKIRINEAAKILLSFKEQVVPAVTNVSDLTDDSSKKQQAGVGETDTPEVASEQDVECDAANGANILESAPLEPTSADRDVRPQQKVESFVSCSNCGQDVLLNPSKLRELQKETLKHHVVASNQRCREYTGLPSVDLLNFLFDRLDNTEAVVGLCEQNQGEELYGRRNKGHKMSRFDCLLLTLIMLRKGFDVDHVSFLFNIAPFRVVRIFTTWVDFLSQSLLPMIKWPTQELARFNMPAEFEAYPGTHCILGYADFHFDRSVGSAAQKATVLGSRDDNTAKVLLGIHPCGAITFLSKSFDSSTSNQEILTQSGFLDLVEKGDNIMADPECDIRHLLVERGATLNEAAIGKGKSAHPSTAVCGRKQVEQVIRRINAFKILRGNVHIKTMPSLDKLLSIVAAISNLESPLCSPGGS